MFDIGFWEIALIMVLALVILGPERLPHAARTAGRFVGKARRYIEGVKSEVEKEFDTGELKRILHNQEIQIRELQGKLNEAGEEITSDLNKEALTEFNDDDPGNPHQEVVSSYDMYEEDDEGYDELEVTPRSEEKDETVAADEQPSPGTETDPHTSEKSV